MGLDLVRYAICLEYSWTSESLEGYSLKYKPCTTDLTEGEPFYYGHPKDPIVVTPPRMPTKAGQSAILEQQNWIFYQRTINRRKAHKTNWKHLAKLTGVTELNETRFAEKQADIMAFHTTSQRGKAQLIKSIT